MSRTLVIQNSGFWNKGAYNRSRAEKKLALTNVFCVRKKKAEARQNGQSSLTLIGITLAVLAFLSGALYLYQVNSIATKGYELKEVESRIQDSEKEAGRLKIKEAELKSMYNIEKATENLDPVTPLDISYLELPGPVAMK